MALMSYELSPESAMPKLLLRGLAILGYEGYANATSVPRRTLPYVLSRLSPHLDFRIQSVNSNYYKEIY
jgi:hypothetical protein